MAAFCIAAKLLESTLLMEEADYGGVAAMTGQVRETNVPTRQCYCMMC